MGAIWGRLPEIVTVDDEKVYSIQLFRVIQSSCANRNCQADSDAIDHIVDKSRQKQDITFVSNHHNMAIFICVPGYEMQCIFARLVPGTKQILSQVTYESFIGPLIFEQLLNTT